MRGYPQSGEHTCPHPPIAVIHIRGLLIVYLCFSSIYVRVPTHMPEFSISLAAAPTQNHNYNKGRVRDPTNPAMMVTHLQAINVWRQMGTLVGL